MTAFDKTMGNASDTAKNLAKNAKGSVVEIEAIPKASRAAAAGMKLLSVAMNVVGTVIISTLITGISKMIGASEEMSQQAAEATEKYKEQSSSIDEYKNKITELKTSLDTENLSYSDGKDKRNQLLEIQKQLIDTYGDEAKGIDLVNGSLDSQIEKLDKLNKQKRQEWENSVNELSTGQQWQKWGGFAGLSLLAILKPQEWFNNKTAVDWLNNFDNTTNIERITEKFENFSKSIEFGSISDDFKKQLESYNGVSFDGLKMTISGDAKTVAETVSQIQTDVIGSRKDLQWLNQNLKDVYNSAKKIVDENWDTYNTALENKILNDEQGFEYYGKLTDAYEAYQDAVKDGDESAIAKAKENYSNLLNDINNSDMDDSFKKFFENMYPDIADIINEWKFEVNIVPKLNTNKDGLKDDIETVKGLTTDEIEAAFDNNGEGVTKEQWEAITNLNSEAQANGLDLSTFLNQLREAGYLISQVDKDFDNAISDLQNKFDKDGIRKQLEGYNKDDTIDFTVRPVIDTSKLKEKGWDDAGEGTATVYSSTYYSEDFGMEEGKALVVTPILPDGTVLSPEELEEYARKILSGEDVDVDIKMGMFDGDNYKEEADKFANTIHELHEKYFSGENDVDWKEYFNEQSINTQEELDKWNEVTKNAKTAEEAMQMWADSVKTSNSEVTKTFDELSKSIDEVQSAYETVKSVMQEYNETGIMTVDSLQSLLSLDNQYLSMLFNEKGQLDLSSEALKRYTAGLIQNMTIKKMQDYFSYIEGLGVEEAEHLANASAIQQETQSLQQYLITLLSGNEFFSKLSTEAKAYYLNQLASIWKLGEAGLQSLDNGGIYKDAADKAKKAAEAKEDYAEKVADLNEQLAEKEKSFAESMAEAWEKEHLESLKETLEQRANILEQYARRISVIEWGEDILDSADYDNKISLLSDKLSTSMSYAKDLKTEFEYLADLTPNTGDEAQEIASAIEDIGEKMRDNISVVRETAVELEKIRIEQITSFAETNFNALEHEANRIEALINVLKNKSKSSYSGMFTEDLLLADTMFSSLATTGSKALKERQKEDALLIDEQQETQNTINDIVKKSLEQQAEDNKKAREKERQQLIDDMEKTRKDIQKQLDDAKKDYEEKLEEFTSLTKSGTKSISDAFSSMISSIQSDVDGFSAQNMIDEIDRAKNAAEKAKIVSVADLKGEGFKSPFDEKGTVTSHFGPRKSPTAGASSNHQGTDISKPEGTGILAVKGGKVTQSGEISGYGNAITIESTDGYTILYAHMKAKSSYKVGDEVKQGDTIGYVGQTGTATAPHLHIEVSRGGVKVDPENYINFYAEGTNNAPGGTAIVGEDGRELIVTPDGGAVMADEPALIDLPKGSRVIPNDETEKLIENGTEISDGRYIYKNGVYIPNPNYGALASTSTAIGEILADTEPASPESEALLASKNSLKLSGGTLEEGVTLVQTQNGILHIIGLNGMTTADFGDDIKLLTPKEVADYLSDDAALDSILAQHKGDLENRSTYNRNQIFAKVESSTNESNRRIIDEYVKTQYGWDGLTDEEKADRLDSYRDFLYTEQGTVAKENANAIMDGFKQYMDDVKNGLVLYDTSIVEEYREKYQEQMDIATEAEQYFIDKETERRENLVSDLERYAKTLSEELEAVNDHISNQIEKREALLNIKQKEYDLTNKMTSAQREIDKAIATSRISTQYLDEETRKLIFNEEDYEKLSAKISSIQSESIKLSLSYSKKINGLAEDELYKKEQITAEYERQMEMKEKELDIAKAEVDLRQKQQQLDNVLMEKNVRIRKDGEWVWTHNADNLRQATEALADAQAVLDDAKTQKAQQIVLNGMQGTIDGMNTAIGKNQQEITEMDAVVGRVKTAVENLEDPVKGIDTILKDLRETGLPALDDVITDVVGSFSKVLGLNVLSAEGKERATAILPDGSSVGVLMKDGKVTNRDLPSGTVVYTASGKYTITGGNSGEYTSKKSSSATDSSSYGSEVSYVTATTPEGTEIVAHIKDGKTVTEGLKAGTIVHTNDGDYEITGGSAGKYTSKKIVKNAGGSFSTKDGLSYVNEEGLELYHTPYGDLIPLDTGGTIFDASQTKILWDFSKDPIKILESVKTVDRTSVVNHNYNMYGNALFDGNNPEEIFKQLADFMMHNRYKS